MYGHMVMDFTDRMKNVIVLVLMFTVFNNDGTKPADDRERDL